ncbi:MAG: acyl carrier protein [Glaciecola sp.]|jgi:acyl carrier protein
MEMTQTEIREAIKEILNEMIDMYDLPATEITDELLLIETLGFSSVDIMHMLASVDMRFERHLPYDKIMLKNDEYVTDLSFREIVNFVHENFDFASTDPKQMS